MVWYYRDVLMNENNNENKNENKNSCKHKVWVAWANKVNKSGRNVSKGVMIFCERLDSLVFNNEEFSQRIRLIERIFSKKEVALFFWFLIWNYYTKYISFDSSGKLGIDEKEIELFIDYAEQMVWAVENVLLGKKYPVDKAIKLSRIDKVPRFLMKSIQNLNMSLRVPFWNIRKKDSREEVERKEMYQEEDKFFWENLFKMVLMYYSDVVQQYNIDDSIKQFICSDNDSLNGSFGYVQSVYKQHKPVYSLVEKYFSEAKEIGIKRYFENMVFLNGIEEIVDMNGDWNDNEVSGPVSLLSKNENEPIHIGLIMDGNRRFDKDFGLCKRHHFLGALNCINLLSHMLRIKNVQEITFYTLSADNLAKRSNEEKADLFWAMDYFISKISTAIQKTNHQILEKINTNVDGDSDGNNKGKSKQYQILFLGFIGEIEKLSQDKCDKLVELEEIINGESQNIIEKLMEKGLIDSGDEVYHRYINFAVVYDGQREIEAATETMLKKAMKKKKLGKKFKGKIEDFLWLKSNIDLVVRTGDVVRTSSFFPYQTIYSEWFFRDEMWPRLNEYDLQNILSEYYTKRQRRFGK